MLLDNIITLTYIGNLPENHRHSSIIRQTLAFPGKYPTLDVVLRDDSSPCGSAFCFGSKCRGGLLVQRSSLTLTCKLPAPLFFRCVFYQRIPLLYMLLIETEWRSHHRARPVYSLARSEKANLA